MRWIKILTMLAIVGFLGIALFVLDDRAGMAPQVALVSSPYLYNFNVDGVLNEAGDMNESTSPYWWLNSGGVMNIQGGSGSTNIGEAASLSKWRLLYKISSSLDTDQGFHPQNLFRLVSRNTWSNFTVQAYFKILEDNLSSSYNRNLTNGLFLMSRYQDGDNLYYSGLRVDGIAVIKKKRSGIYTTLAQVKVLPGTYDRNNNPNLLPKDTWIGLRSHVETIGNSVKIDLYVDLRDDGNWTRILTAEDAELANKSQPIFEPGFVGIRTDFMDVGFRDFLVETI